MIEMILRDAGALLITSKDGTVQLVHISLREFLHSSPEGLRKSEPKTSDGKLSLSDFFIDPASFNQILTSALVIYFDLESTESFESNACKPQDLTVGTTFPLMGYASCHWIDHVAQCKGLPDTFGSKVEAFLMSSTSLRWYDRLKKIYNLDGGYMMVLEASLRDWAVQGLHYDGVHQHWRLFSSVFRYLAEVGANSATKAYGKKRKLRWKKMKFWPTSWC